MWALLHRGHCAAPELQATWSAGAAVCLAAAVADAAADAAAALAVVPLHPVASLIIVALVLLLMMVSPGKRMDLSVVSLARRFSLSCRIQRCK